MDIYRLRYERALTYLHQLDRVAPQEKPGPDDKLASDVFTLAQLVRSMLDSFAAIDARGEGVEQNEEPWKNAKRMG